MVWSVACLKTYRGYHIKQFQRLRTTTSFVCLHGLVELCGRQKWIVKQRALASFRGGSAAPTRHQAEPKTPSDLRGSGSSIHATVMPRLRHRRITNPRIHASDIPTRLTCLIADWAPADVLMAEEEGSGDLQSACQMTAMAVTHHAHCPCVSIGSVVAIPSQLESLRKRLR